jgi:serine/threonine protein kinase
MGPETLVLGGRFKVLRHIGGGGMSEVYLAVQVSLGRQVALKVLKRDLGKRADMAERFRREALLLSTVEHPAVVRIIDFESTPEANVLVLELAEGDTLETVLSDGPMKVERALPVLAQLAEGLAAIHEKGIIHRDLKPQNVVLTPTARGEQARLLDFGIARLMEMAEGVTLDGPLPENPMISHPGQVVGTPAFVAPEQALAKPLDARTDVYAFGVLAYRLLSGQFPLPGPGSNDFLKQHVSMTPRKLDESLTTLAKYPELVALVMQCLEKVPDARPASAQVLYERLLRMIPQSPFESAVSTPSRRVIAPGGLATPEPAAISTADRWEQVRKKAGAVRRTWWRLSAAMLRRMRGVPAEWRRSLLIVTALCLVAPGVWAMWPPTPTERAALLIRQGRSEGAVALLDQRLTEATWETPELLALKAAALHQLGRDADERQLLRLNPYQALHAAHPLLLDALAEDFARAEDDVELRALLKVVPGVLLVPHFVALSREKLGSEKQWGALRYLDLQAKDQLENAGERYTASLTARECYIRSGAARRLAELKATDAIVALRTLSETPKEKSADGLKDCGQDDAAEAIRELKRE